MTDSWIKRAFILVALPALLVVTGWQLALAFSDSATNNAVRRGNAELEKCRQVEKSQRFDCVGRALEKANSSIRKPDYIPASCCGQRAKPSATSANSQHSWTRPRASSEAEIDCSTAREPQAPPPRSSRY